MGQAACAGFVLLFNVGDEDTSRILTEYSSYFVDTLYIYVLYVPKLMGIHLNTHEFEMGPLLVRIGPTELVRLLPPLQRHNATRPTRPTRRIAHQSWVTDTSAQAWADVSCVLPRLDEI
jgi:hypothetical protein